MAFNCDKIVEQEVKELVERFDLKCAIETGTKHGITTLWLGANVKEVHTVELIEDVYRGAAKRCQHLKNIELYHDSSKHMLGELLPKVAEKQEDCVLFYLDAHYAGNSTGLLDEISLIGEYLFDRGVLVIDDFAVPNRPHKYDRYENGVPNDIHYIRDYLDKAYKEYVYYYLNRTDQKRSCRNTGKLYVLPKRLLPEEDWEDLFHFEDGEPYSNH